MEPWYLQRIPWHLPSLKRFNSQVVQKHKVHIPPAKLMSCKYPSCSCQVGEDSLEDAGREQEEWQHVETMVLKDSKVFKTKMCFTVNLLQDLRTTGTITYRWLLQVTPIRPRICFYILEIYSSTTETKDELSQCLGLCVYQLPELLDFV